MCLVKPIALGTIGLMTGLNRQHVSAPDRFRTDGYSPRIGFKLGFSAGRFRAAINSWSAIIGLILIGFVLVGFRPVYSLITH